MFSTFLDLLFPPKCVICGKLGDFVCKSCLKRLAPPPAPFCPACRRESTGGKSCPECRETTSLSALVSAGDMNDLIQKQLVASLKYERLPSLAPLLAGRMARVLKKEKVQFDIITFVPQTKKRTAKRGFNQSELMAKEIGMRFKKPVVYVLKKKKDTKTQVGLGRAARQKNQKNAFEATDRKILKGKRVLIIDDVYTTGATLEECASMLIASGARSVIGAVAASE